MGGKGMAQLMGTNVLIHALSVGPYLHSFGNLPRAYAPFLFA
jgi:hypothetical protein